MICLLMLGWLFVPVYLAAGISTMPEFLRRRFPGGRIRTYLAILSLFIYIFTKISADLFAGSLFITLSIPSLNIYLAVIILLAITVVYAIAGGLKAVIYVEALQVTDFPMKKKNDGDTAGNVINNQIIIFRSHRKSVFRPL